MLIGIDAHTIGHRHTGNETYVLNLLKALREVDSKDRFRVFLTSEGKAAYPDLENGRFATESVPANAWLRFAFALPASLVRDPVDVLHVQYAAPWGTGCTLVTTIHDISHVYLPRQISTAERLRVERLFPATAKRSARIITGSQATKEDLVEHFRVDERRIVVTPYGVSSAYAPIEDRSAIQETLDRYGLEPGYVLYVGTLQPRKNLPRLLKAFDVLKQSEHIAEKLVIVGKKGWLHEEVFETHQSLRAKDDVVFIDYVSDADLPAIYCGARLFVYPSLYEGFGLPPLEAMACGVPVAVSSAPAMPEVVGQAGAYYDPLSVESIAESVGRLLADDGLRRTLAEQGRKRAAGFTWEETARQTLQVYRDVTA